MILPVILSGGAGTRLWPLSRQATPKQFLPLVEQQSLFQATLERLGGIPACLEPLVVCNEEHRFLVAEQLRAKGVQGSAILLEPVGRNTAPAIAAAALFAMERSPDAVLLVMPSDHVIRRPEVFREAVAEGLQAAAEQQRLVTFGIVPDRPETGYGYIRKADEAGGGGVFPVAEFVEKPDQATAEAYVASGDYFWNSGLFMFRADDYLAELGRYAGEILQSVRESFAARETDRDFLRLGIEAFHLCPSESVDYAVMEKTERAAVIPLDAGWSDVGAWSALWEVAGPDEKGNVILGDVIDEDVEGCYLRSERGLLAAVGLRDLVVVETNDAVLVARKDRTQDVKRVVERIKSSARGEHLCHTRVYRPWGTYETVDECARFKVKRIVVKPKQSLSLQLHHHRAEHWVVVTGTARIVRGDEDLLLTEDQSVYIPVGATHRLENPGLIPLEIIEVQTGSYLGEDDIQRFSDNYGRSAAGRG